MKHLGMDLGTKTLGLATSDKLGIIASPYKLIRFNDINLLIEELLEIIAKEKIEVLVLGYPKNMDNSLGYAVQRTIKFKELLQSKCDLPLYLIDERLSTVEAENMLIDANVSRKKRKKIIDEVSASIILDTYLRKVG
ncbi:MAG: Holliday junction resolvase RuvX [Bacilli bacterium]|nr:Holliday junction resolvase RuvX [Bacilli bacterium]MDD3895455.1 Holliday junction resolvase RuvX [Bacilli bacterium]MDD4407456.1 Holliday junction resolvase RuvX [Bacilli bacterium]